MPMAFSSNPLSLSVPDAAFETWLRDTGYLEVVDRRTSDLHRLSSGGDSSSTTASIPSNSFFFVSILSHLGTLLSLFTLNPFSKLTSDDFSGPTPSWTLAFVGFCDSYSFPSSSSQARLRVHENVKRYARNYATLFIICFACSLYQMPIALVGLISSLALWDLLRFCSDKWRVDRYPVVRQALIHTVQCATAVVLFCSNVQFALFCALGVSYAVMILHASFRKLTPAKQPTPAR